MVRSPFGWDLPPGVTHRMIEEQSANPPMFEIYYMNPEEGEKRVLGYTDELPSPEVARFLFGSLTPSPDYGGSGEYLYILKPNGKVLTADENGNWQPDEEPHG